MVGAAPAVGIWNFAALGAWGLAIFVVPGAIVLAASAAPLRRAELFAFAFAASLVLLTATFATSLALSTSIAAGPFLLAGLTGAAAVAARHFGATHAEVSPEAPAFAGSSLTARAALVVLALAAVIAAVAFAPVGSVDRWWYLAYVRGYLAVPVPGLAEPFLGTGQSFARFGVHPWLYGLATWSWLSGLDPVVVYERGAPALVVLASIAAAFALAREMFGAGARARLTVLATMLLWSGAMVPVLARAGEDKVLAAAALLPLCLAAFLRVVRRGRAGEPIRLDVVLLVVAAAATAAVHALAYAFVLVALLPAAALLAASEPLRRRAIAAAVVVLVVVAFAPAVSGLVVRERLSEIGADLASSDHPVVRVHEARERLVELPFGGYAVHPGLLLHPLALLALAGIFTLRRRPAGAAEAPIAHTTRVVLAVATVVPLAIAFVPPLPALAGEVIPPWMVYRVLWLLPLAPLAALAADALSSRCARREACAALLLLALGLPLLAAGARGRLAEVRGRLAAPAGAAFQGMVDAVEALPADALVVAAPELAERLPALTARHVVAALDRSTIVFTGDRQRGEARLRARAALLAGDADGFALARRAGLLPTHAVFDPSARDQPVCGSVLYREGSYALCELAGDDGRDARGPQLEATDSAGARVVAVAECGRPASSRRSPWSAAAPIVTCTVEVPVASHGQEDLRLVLDATTGRAVDELRISVRSAAAPDLQATVRTSAGSAVALRLPPLAGDRLEVRVASSFLPAVRLRRVEITAP